MAKRKSTKAIVIHHTASNRLQDALNEFKRTGKSSHIIVDRDGTAHDLLSYDAVGAHTKQSGYGRSAYAVRAPGLSNNNTFGIEFVAKDNTQITRQQIDWAKKNLPTLQQQFPGATIVGHGEVTPGHRQLSEGMAIVQAMRTGTPNLMSEKEFAAMVGGPAGWETGNWSGGSAFAASADAPTPPADVGTTNQVLKRGVYNNDHVKALQHVLSRAGFYDGKIDGDFGKNTEKAVKAFQQAQNKLNAAAGIPSLAVDGKVGTQTKAAVAAWGKSAAGPEAVAQADLALGQASEPPSLKGTPTPFDMARQTPDVPVGLLGAVPAPPVPDRAVGPLAAALSPSRGNLAMTAPQPGIGGPTPEQFEAAKQQIRDVQGPVQLNPHDIGVDPRNLPVEAGTGGGVLGGSPYTEADVSRNAVQNLRGGLLAGAVPPAVAASGVPISASDLVRAAGARAAQEGPGAGFMRGWGNAQPPTSQNEGPGILSRVHEGLGNASDAIRDFLGMNYAPDDSAGSYVNGTPVTHDAPTRTLTAKPGYGNNAAANAPDSPLRLATEAAARQKATRMQNLAGNEMAGSNAPLSNSVPRKVVTTSIPASQSSLLAANTRPRSPYVAPRAAPSLPSRTVGYAPGAGPGGMAPADPYADFENRRATAFSSLTPTYQPTNPMAASATPDIRPPAPELFTTAPQKQQIPKALQYGLPLALGMVNPMLGAVAGLAMSSGLLGRGGPLSGAFGGNPSVAAMNRAVAGNVRQSDMIGGNAGSASYGRKQSDGSVTGRTSTGTGYTSRDGGNTVSVGGKTYKANRNGRGYARVL